MRKVDWSKPNLVATSEHDEQKHLLRKIRSHLPRIVFDHITAVPNGGQRDVRVAKKLKAEGVSPGYPDLLLDLPRGPFHGFRCEMKRVNAPPSKWPQSQRDWNERLNNVGYLCVLALGAGEAFEQFKAYWDLGEFEMNAAPMRHLFHVKWPERG